jgi:two-component system LytT family response regulator
VEKIKTIIVDDEESARNILSSLLAIHGPQFEIVAKCVDLEEAVLKIEEHQPNLVFLDIEMPNYAGYEITSFIKNPKFDIIFVTAYDHYAVKAFELSAVDYLLKPVDIERLKKALIKFLDQHDSKNQALNYQVLIDSLKEDNVKKIVVQVNGGQAVISVDDIIAIEANESYSLIYTLQGDKHLYSKNLKHFESLLEKNPNFVRTHKSWLINTDFMEKYSKSNLQIELKQGIVAKLSKYKKDQFESAILS